RALRQNLHIRHFLDNRGDMGTKGAAELLRRGFRVLNGVVQRRRGHDHRITNAAFVPLCATERISAIVIAELFSSFAWNDYPFCPPEAYRIRASSRSKGGERMWSTFNVVMRIISSLIGIAMICMGTVWILQGLNLAFRVGFMVGDFHWTIYGAILALVGIAEVVWSNTRQRS